MLMTKGILIAGYGTRKGNLEEVMEKQAARMRARGIPEVHIGYFRVSSPSIPEAAAEMAAAGIDDVLVIPYYIAEGKMTRSLIPEKLGLPCSYGVTEKFGRPMKVRTAPAFGAGDLLASILCDKLADAGASKDDGILVLGHGTLDPLSGNTEAVADAENRLRRYGFRHVAHAYNEFNEPSVADAVSALAAEGVGRIVAVPMFIAMGLHLGEEIPEQIGIPPYSDGGEIEAGGRRIRVDYLRPVEDDPRLCDAMIKIARDFYGM